MATQDENGTSNLSGGSFSATTAPWPHSNSPFGWNGVTVPMGAFEGLSLGSESQVTGRHHMSTTYVAQPFQLQNSHMIQAPAPIYYGNNIHSQTLLQTPLPEHQEPSVKRRRVQPAVPESSQPVGFVVRPRNPMLREHDSDEIFHIEFTGRSLNRIAPYEAMMEEVLDLKVRLGLDVSPTKELLDRLQQLALNNGWR
ncbi:hypothetical protein QR680_003080 [Steinernema hermaphroditum]|uniref:Uncharacterized protein n=1 Tax=Steinernema hermaphroditum TaxID=289476 RepID=A0AA39LJH3_9BILA|nr:hypothetical protein QR680_003080 [Steinernema hermaphroditum]